MGLPDKGYTESDLARARRSGKIVGWLQGGAAVVIGGMILNVVGWVPTVLVVGGLAYVAYRLLLKPRPSEPRAE